MRIYGYLDIMTLQQIKDEVKSLESNELQDLTSFVVQLKRAHDPARKREITEKLDDSSKKWIPLDEIDDHSKN